MFHVKHNHIVSVTQFAVRYGAIRLFLCIISAEILVTLLKTTPFIGDKIR